MEEYTAAEEYPQGDEADEYYEYDDGPGDTTVNGEPQTTVRVPPA